MSQNTTATQPRTVQTADRGGSMSTPLSCSPSACRRLHPQLHCWQGHLGHLGRHDQPEFIISAFCLTITVVRPNIGQALVISLISAAVIQITTTSPFVVLRRGIAMLMAAIVNAAGGRSGQAAIAIVATFDHLCLGVIFGNQDGHARRDRRARAAIAVIAMTAVFNAILVGALYLHPEGPRLS
ncbi:MAG: hypothetical protein ACLRM9_02460 [Collinsella aerofaciens]